MNIFRMGDTKIEKMTCYNFCVTFLPGVFQIYCIPDVRCFLGVCFSFSIQISFFEGAVTSSPWLVLCAADFTTLWISHHKGPRIPMNQSAYWNTTRILNVAVALICVYRISLRNQRISVGCLSLND